jgi:hypothetical protein
VPAPLTVSVDIDGLVFNVTVELIVTVSAEPGVPLLQFDHVPEDDQLPFELEVQFAAWLMDARKGRLRTISANVFPITLMAHLFFSLQHITDA